VTLGHGSKNTYYYSFITINKIPSINWDFCSAEEQFSLFTLRYPLHTQRKYNQWGQLSTYKWGRYCSTVCSLCKQRNSRLVNKSYGKE